MYLSVVMETKHRLRVDVVGLDVDFQAPLEGVAVSLDLGHGDLLGNDILDLGQDPEGDLWESVVISEPLFSLFGGDG